MRCYEKAAHFYTSAVGRMVTGMKKVPPKEKMEGGTPDELSCDGNIWGAVEADTMRRKRKCSVVSSN